MEEKRFLLPHRIDSLQALRFLGAMCITVYHFTGLQGELPFDFSHAVYLFYMISAFAAMLSTEAPEKRRFFLTRRAIRLLPLYWGLTVATFAAGLLLPEFVGYTPTPAELIKSLLFIPYRRVTAKAGSALRPLVGLGHTLQMEMLFYVFFFIALHISRKYRGYIAAVLCAATALVGVLFPTKNPVIHFYTANPYVWTSFIAGLLIYGAFYLLQKKQFRVNTGALPAAAAIALTLGLAVPALFCGTSVWYDIGLFAAVLVCGLVWSACGKKTPKLLVKLGDISYSYYLLHYYVLTLAVRALGINSFSFRNLFLAVITSAAAWWISWVSWYLIENKLSGMLLKLLPERRSPHSEAS